MCEVRDYVLTSSAPELFVRGQNEACNVELRRRGLPALVVPSGELVGDAVVWSPFPLGCAQGWVDPGTIPP